MTRGVRGRAMPTTQWAGSVRSLIPLRPRPIPATPAPGPSPPRPSSRRTVRNTAFPPATGGRRWRPERTQGRVLRCPVAPAAHTRIRHRQRIRHAALPALRLQPRGKRIFASYPAATHNPVSAPGPSTTHWAARPRSPKTASWVADYGHDLRKRVPHPREQSEVRRDDHPLPGLGSADQRLPTHIAHPVAPSRTSPATSSASHHPAAQQPHSPTDGTLAVDRAYTYNGHQELAHVEPETGATLMGYDNAGNLAGPRQACRPLRPATARAPFR